MNTAKTNSVKENWKSPPSLKCQRIEVSNLGRIRALPSVAQVLWLGKKQGRKRSGHLLHPGKDTRGRYIVCGGTIRKGLQGRTYLLHRLVAECFVSNPKPNEYKFVFFKNGDMSDCRASNLIWGDIEDLKRVKRGKNILYKIKVLCNGLSLGEYYGCGEAARALGVTKQAVHNALMHGGFCKGYEIVAVKSDEYKPNIGIEELRRESFPKMKVISFPSGLYSAEQIPLEAKAVF